jgi:hypothetical protein
MPLFITYIILKRTINMFVSRRGPKPKVTVLPRVGRKLVLCFTEDQIYLHSGAPVKSENHTEHKNTPCGQNAEFSSYLTGRTLRLGYKAQPVIAV